MLALTLLKLLIVLIISAPFVAVSKVKVCPTVIIHKEISLSPVEERLICGDEKLEAYAYIPNYQAQYFLTGFLQARGYLLPDFEVVGDVLHVYPGKLSEVKEIDVYSDNDDVSKYVLSELKRLYEKKKLTTKLLNSMEAEAQGILRERGYPCSKVTSEVNTTTGTVSVTISDLNFFRFGEVKKESIEGLNYNALARYYPFNADKAFDETLLRLTEKRMTRAEVVDGTYFLENCSPDGKEFSLEQRFIVGPPRTLRFGIGASTEQGPMARVRWSNNRLESMASILSANLQVSFRSQSVNITSDHFFWKEHPRSSLLSSAEIIRESQIDYEQLIFRLRPHFKYTLDLRDHHQIYTLGPTYEAGTFQFEENTDIKSFSTGVIEGGLEWTEHSYEFFDIHPEEGDQFSFNFDYRHPGLGFSDELLKINSSFVKLGRLTTFGRGTLIGGARLNAGTTFVRSETSIRGLPPAVKFYGGGSDDIRGFLLRTLPKNDGVGALSKLSLKLELRKTYFFKESIEGFTFVDYGHFGEKSWSILPRLWYSPGVGLRWLSPIGLVQGYIARGLSRSPKEDFGNFYYLGLGGTF